MSCQLSYSAWLIQVSVKFIGGNHSYGYLPEAGYSSILYWKHRDLVNACYWLMKK